MGVGWGIEEDCCAEQITIATVVAIQLQRSKEKEQCQMSVCLTGMYTVVNEDASYCSVVGKTLSLDHPKDRSKEVLETVWTMMTVSLHGIVKVRFRGGGE